MRKPKAAPIPEPKVPESPTTVHQWRIGLDKYSYNLEHWVQVPDEHGGTRFVQKTNDTQYCSTLEQLARALRDVKFRAYFKDGQSVQDAIRKSTEDILAFFRGETEFVEAVMKTDRAQSLLREQASSDDSDEESDDSDD